MASTTEPSYTPGQPGQAPEASASIGQKVEDATAAVACGMQSLAGTMREKIPQGGVLGEASQAMARGLDRSGRYLEQEGLQGIGDDLTDLVRRNPIPALLLGIGVGYLLARATRS